MSDSKMINRRMLLGQLAFTFAGAAVLGSTMNRCMRAEWIETSIDLIEASPEGSNMTRDEVRKGMEAYYDTQLKPTTNKLTTALGAIIGYVSHDEATKDVPEPDIY